MPDEKRFGALLKAKRTEESKHMTLQQVASQIGVSVSYLHDVEAGRRAPFDFERIKQLAKILGCSSLGLAGAAAISNGHYELLVREKVSEAHTVGALLQSRWTALSEADLLAIKKIITKKETKK